MKAIWDSKAKKAQRQVASYIRKEFGVKRAKKFRQEVDDTVNQLMRSPGIGQIDPLFSDRARTYRSVIIVSAIISVICALVGMLMTIIFSTPVGATIVIVDMVCFFICVLIGLIRKK